MIKVLTHVKSSLPHVKKYFKNGLTDTSKQTKIQWKFRSRRVNVKNRSVPYFFTLTRERERDIINVSVSVP